MELPPITSMRRTCLVLSVVVVAVIGQPGCAHSHKSSKLPQLGVTASEYRKLVARANHGNAQAAEKLANLWYGVDNTQAVKWLEMAAQNGSARAAAMLPTARQGVEN